MVVQLTFAHQLHMCSRLLQSCGWSGGVWDDRDIVSWATAGGRCISPAEAAKVLVEDPEAEEVLILASNDGNVTGGRRGGEGVAGMGRIEGACCRMRALPAGCTNAVLAEQPGSTHAACKRLIGWSLQCPDAAPLATPAWPRIPDLS
jgi:hypothetical protein